MKMPDMSIFNLNIWKNYHHVWNQQSPVSQRWCSFCKKHFNIGLKMVYLGIFGQQLQKSIVIFEISNLELVNMQNFVKNKKTSNLCSKVPYLGIFGLQIWKSLSYLKSVLSNLSKCKFLFKTKKTSNLGTKTLYLGIFIEKFEKNYCHIWNQHAKFLKMQKLVQNKQFLHWEQKYHIWVILGCNFETVVIFQTTNLKLVRLQI